MTRWLVQLEGDRLDLEEFPRYFTRGSLHAIAVGDEVFLTGPRLDECADAGEVFAAAAADCHEMFGVLKLLIGDLRRPSVGRVVREHDDGRREGFVFASATVEGRATVSVVLNEGDTRQDSQAEELLAAARSSRYLRHALDLWATEDLTWARLYTLLETLEQHLGAKVDAAGLCSRAERIRFTRTANTAEVSGRESRHAPGRFGPLGDPMTLQGAIAFIGQLLEKALRIEGRGLITCSADDSE